MAKNRKLVILVCILLLGVLGQFIFGSVSTIPGKYFDKPLPEVLEHWRSREVYICPECMRILYEEVEKEKLEHDKNTNLFFFAAGPDFEIPKGYESFLSKGRCPFHNLDISTTKTTDIPTAPQVVDYLPDDTDYENRYYETSDIFSDPNAQLIHVSIVTSGKDKRSIHRPETCLPSQGNQIIKRKRVWLDVPESKRKKLDMTVIYLQKVSSEGRTERSVAMYFFAGNKRVTSNNFKRLAYMAWDRMVLGQNYRWAYILMFARAQTHRETEKAMLEFITEFFPRVEK